MHMKTLTMPANFAAMDEEEMTYTTGGCLLRWIFKLYSRFFDIHICRRYNPELEQALLELTESHGSIIDVHSNDYIFDDGFVYTFEPVKKSAHPIRDYFKHSISYFHIL